MNKAIVAGLAAGVLLIGLVFSPLFTGGLSLFSGAQAQSTGQTKHFTLVASEKVLQIAPDSDLHPGGVMYNAMVFNGTIPGPVIAVHQGDKVEITLVNEGQRIHSLDFHAAITTTGANSGPVKAGESKTWSFEAKNAGAFFYHCSGDGLNGVWEHIANGMYGAVVIHPHNEKPAKEFYIAFGQVYSTGADTSQNPFGTWNGTGSFDAIKFLAKNPDLILTNGMAHKYAPSVGAIAKITLNKPLAQELSDALAGKAGASLKDFFVVKPGEPTRWYIVNAGPNDYVAFHFIGAQMDVRDGSIINRYGTQDKNDETWTIPPGSASVIEAVFPQGGGPEGSPDGSPGVYVGVDHEMTDVVKGGAFAVIALDSEPAMANDQPEGTAVMSMEDTMKAQSSMTPTTPSMPSGNQTSGNQTSMSPSQSPDFKIKDIGMVNGNPTITVEGTAGGTEAKGTNDIYAYVMVTDNGTWAVASHGFNDSAAQSGAGDTRYHSHGGIVLDSNNCITAINGAGTAMLNGDQVSISGTNATAITKAMTVRLTVGQNICVAEVFDSKG